MKVQDLLDKVRDQNISYYEVGGYSIQIKDSFQESYRLLNVSVDKDSKVISIKITK